MPYPCNALWRSVCVVSICAAWATTACADCNCRGNAVRVASQVASPPAAGLPQAPVPDPTFGGQTYPNAPAPPAPGPRSNLPPMPSSPYGTQSSPSGMPPSPYGAQSSPSGIPPSASGSPGAGSAAPGYAPGQPSNSPGTLGAPLGVPGSSSISPGGALPFDDDIPGGMPLSSSPQSLSGSGTTALPTVVDRFNVPVPPGTLGRTYQRRSTLAPDDRHPRWAAVDVHLPENVDVSSRGLKATWTGEVWRLETDSPLLPGLPHIYAIKAERPTGTGEKSTDVRWVRLIMGRIVELDF